MNDTARWSREPCPCGRTYRVIEKITGRLADQLYDLDGRAVNCTVIGFAFDGMRNIEKAQVAQVAADRWIIRIVAGARYTDADGQRVLDKLAAQVSARVSAQVELVRDIPSLAEWQVQMGGAGIPERRSGACGARDARALRIGVSRGPPVERRWPHTR